MATLTAAEKAAVLTNQNTRIATLRIYTTGGSATGTLLATYNLTAGTPSVTNGNCTYTAPAATAVASGTPAAAELWSATASIVALTCDGTGTKEVTAGAITSGTSYSLSSFTFGY